MKKIIFFVIFLITLGSIGLNVYQYLQHQKDLELIKNPNLIFQNEESKIIGNLSKLIEIPSGEQPTIATVQEKDKLQNEPFFAKAENGDKIIVFPQSKKALIYRESTNKIIEFAQLAIETENPPAPTAKSNPTPTENPDPTEEK